MTRNDRNYNWYRLPNCRSKEEYTYFKEAKQETKNTLDDLLADFKIALAAVTSGADNKSLEAQFSFKK